MSAALQLQFFMVQVVNYSAIMSENQTVPNRNCGFFTFFSPNRTEINWSQPFWNRNNTIWLAAFDSSLWLLYYATRIMAA